MSLLEGRPLEDNDDSSDSSGEGRRGDEVNPGVNPLRPVTTRADLGQKKRARSRWKEKNKCVMARKCVHENTYTPFFVLLAGLEPGTSPFSPLLAKRS